MSEHDENVCEKCGQTLTSRYAMSRGLRDTLRAMSRFVEQKGLNMVHTTKELTNEGIITANQQRNLETHGIRMGVVAHVPDEPGNFAITRRGFAFLNGEPIPKYAYAEKRRKGKGTRTYELSAETCVAKDFNKKDEYWEVPGFEIVEGRVIHPEKKV